MELSADQNHALERLMAWCRKPEGRSLTLGGYAGTGKTTLIAKLRKELAETDPDKTVAFCAYTGKASQVLRTMLENDGALMEGDTCGTIHALLYSPYMDKNGQVVGWMRTKDIEADLIVVDEASMVTDGIWQDLLATRVPVIAVGDHGQLPPVEGNFNVMLKPDLTLDRIHRQAEGNPIIQLAWQARETGKIAVGDFGKSVRKFSYATHDASEIDDLQEHLFSNLHDEMLVLCGRNKTRVELNRAIRNRLGRESDEPEGGDRVVCLRNTYTQPGGPIYNGMVGVIETISPYEPHWYDASIFFPDEGRDFDGRIARAQFNRPDALSEIEGLHWKEIGERFDFGYALTVHKAQGSQAKTVVLFEERFQKADDEQWKRWLYTAVTRARENLYIIGPE